LFTVKSGNAILEEMYVFSDKGGRNLALRPELTAPVMRCYVEKFQMEPKPLKLYYLGNCYRYDRPQKGRYREFMQAGCELIGTDTAEASAELIGLAYLLLKRIGVENIKLDIGHIGLLRLILRQLCLSDEQITTILPLIDKELFNEIPEVLKEFNLTDDKISQFMEIIQHAKLKTLHSFFQSDPVAVKELKRLEEILSYLQKILKNFSFSLNMGIVRGLDYYSGVVFEIKAPNLGAEKQICGGGEYELISLFGGQPTPTAGFALGFDRIILAMEYEKVSFPILCIDYFIIPVTPNEITAALLMAEHLRSQQKKVGIDLMRRGIGKALKYANAQNAKYTILIGPDELEQNIVTIRDMTTGHQEAVPLDKLIPNLSL
jgi:histidyl-tRNA synthetase